jgi:hypothetical protein
MDKTNIPTKELKLKHSERVVKYYEWLTESEENEHQELMLGDNKLEVSDNTETEEMTFMVGIAQVNGANRYLVEHLLVDITYDEFDTLHPGDRQLIKKTLDNVKEKKV